MLYRAKTRRRGADIYIGLVYRPARSLRRAFFVQKISGGEEMDPVPHSRSRYTSRNVALLEEGHQTPLGRNDRNETLLRRNI